MLEFSFSSKPIFFTSLSHLSLSLLIFTPKSEQASSREGILSGYRRRHTESGEKPRVVRQGAEIRGNNCSSRSNWKRLGNFSRGRREQQTNRAMWVARTEFPVSSPEFRGEAPHVSLGQTHSVNFLQEYDDQETDHIRQIRVGPDCIQIAAAGLLR
jgi:hypothetical protein